MSKINLSKLQDGDTVVFRCEGKAVANKVECVTDGVGIYFNGIMPMMYFNNGRCFAVDGKVDTPFDIVDIIPKEFDFADAEQGMAFKFADGNIFYFIAEDKTNNNCVIIGELNGQGEFFNIDSCCKSNLSRAPKHDIDWSNR